MHREEVGEDRRVSTVSDVETQETLFSSSFNHVFQSMTTIMTKLFTQILCYYKI